MKSRRGRTPHPLTQIPLDRTPFPLPPHVEVPIYFTAQPGGTHIRGPDGIGARIYYPNLGKKAPSTEFNFWHDSTREKWFYAGEKGWWVYGKGRVTADGSQIIPHPGVSVYELRDLDLGSGITITTFSTPWLF
jgi:hypothetical protein